MFFKFRDRKRCPCTYTLSTVTGVQIREERCKLRIDHDSPYHISESGQAWLNSEPMRKKIETAVK